MSAITPSVPYVAPWATNFRSYSVQTLTVPKTATNVLGVTIPDGQWWRIIYWRAQLACSASAGSRFLQVQITNSASTVVGLFLPPGVTGASGTAQYVFGPGLTSFSNTADPTNATNVTALPDMLWQWGYSLNILGSILASDTLSPTNTLAVQVFTEDATTPGVLTLTPGPVIV